MFSRKKKVFVALSGGVDSSTAAALLLEAGYDCSAVFMITNGRAAQARTDAERVASKLGIKLYVPDLRSDFEQVLDYFCDEYKSGRTPNPCVFCNRFIKFGKVFDFARAAGADFFATGHYARVLKTDDGIGLYAADTAKDQSYALAMIRREVLRHLLLPIGDRDKDRTRQIAASFALGTQHKAESQEICFIPDNDYAAVIEQGHPELAREGNIVDSSGKILGRHNGTHRFTIGQRRGLRVAMGRAYYVTGIDAASNTVTLGPKNEVMHGRLSTSNVNWLCDMPQSSFEAKVKIRYNSAAAAAIVKADGNGAVVRFDEPVWAITPGQLAAFYVRDQLGQRLVGGGWIASASD